MTQLVVFSLLKLFFSPQHLFFFMTSHAERARIVEAQQLLADRLPFQACGEGRPSADWTSVYDSATKPIFVTSCVYDEGVLEWKFIYWRKKDKKWVSTASIDTCLTAYKSTTTNDFLFYSSGGSMRLSDALTVTTTALFRSVLDLSSTELPLKFQGMLPVAIDESSNKRARRKETYRDHHSSDDDDFTEKRGRKSGAKQSNFHHASPAPGVAGSSSLQIDSLEPVSIRAASAVGPSKAERKSKSANPPSLDSDIHDFLLEVQQKYVGTTTDLSELQSEYENLALEYSALVDCTQQKRAIDLWKGADKEFDKSWAIHNQFAALETKFLNGTLVCKFLLFDIMEYFHQSILVSSGFWSMAEKPALADVDLLWTDTSRFSQFTVTSNWTHLLSVQYSPSEIDYDNSNFEQSWKCGNGEYLLWRAGEHISRQGDLAETKGYLGRGYYYRTTMDVAADVDLSHPRSRICYLDRVFVGSAKVCSSSAPLDVQWVEGHHSIVCDGLVAVPQKKFCCPFLRIEYKLMPK